MNDTTECSEAMQKLGAMIKDIRIVMLTTAMPDGTLRARPMATQQAPFDGDLWFFTGADSSKVHEIEDDQHVSLAYVSAQDNLYLSISGRATFLRDRAKAEQLWTPAMKAWFPGGLDDPDLALLKVSVEQAEYWDTPSSTMVHVAGFIKAVATGQRYQPGQNEKIDLEKTGSGSM